MNEQIKQLAKQAGFYKYGDDFEDIIEKFAELIVLECMRMCEVTEMSFVTHGCDVEASGAITVRKFIAEHFEVGDIPEPSKPS
jgi:hypothetical protein